MNPGGWQKVFQYKGKKVISRLGPELLSKRLEQAQVQFFLIQTLDAVAASQQTTFQPMP